MRSSRRSVLALVALAGATALAVAGWRDWQAERLGSRLAQAARPGEIEMLSSVSCVYCAAARAWFTAHRVPYSECFIEREPDCAQRYAALQGYATPLLMVRGQRQVGFSPPRIVAVFDATLAREGP